jgi:putative transposase
MFLFVDIYSWFAFNEVLSVFATNASIFVHLLDALPDHPVHPKEELSLAKAIGETHKHYTKMINMRERWSGYLWQGCFASLPMDESYLLGAGPMSNFILWLQVW